MSENLVVEVRATRYEFKFMLNTVHGNMAYNLLTMPANGKLKRELEDALTAAITPSPHHFYGFSGIEGHIGLDMYLNQQDYESIEQLCVILGHIIDSYIDKINNMK